MVLLHQTNKLLLRNHDAHAYCQCYQICKNKANGTWNPFPTLSRKPLSQIISWAQDNQSFWFVSNNSTKPTEVNLWCWVWPFQIMAKDQLSWSGFQVSVVHSKEQCYLLNFVTSMITTEALCNATAKPTNFYITKISITFFLKNSKYNKPQWIRLKKKNKIQTIWLDKSYS